MGVGPRLHCTPEQSLLVLLKLMLENFAMGPVFEWSF